MKDKLKKENIPYDEVNPFEETIDNYAKRGKNGGYFPQCDNRWDARLCPKQRGERAFCDGCENTKWARLDVKKIIAHLLGYKEDGSDVIGVYPLLPNGMCRFIVFDFDNHEKGTEATDFANTDNEWYKEVDALRKMCEINGNSVFVDENWNAYPNQWDILLNKTEKLVYCIIDI